MKDHVRWGLVAAGLCLAGPAGAHHQSGHKTAAAPATPAATVTLTGHVVDAGCYLVETDGTAAEKCSGRTLGKERPMGLLTSTGKLYLLIAPTGDPSAYEACRKSGAGRVQLVGRVRERRGLRAFEVMEIKPTRLASR